jgi:hypothetical protein
VKKAPAKKTSKKGNGRKIWWLNNKSKTLVHMAYMDLFPRVDTRTMSIPNPRALVPLHFPTRKHRTATLTEKQVLTCLLDFLAWDDFSDLEIRTQMSRMQEKKFPASRLDTKDKAEVTADNAELSDDSG